MLQGRVHATLGRPRRDYRNQTDQGTVREGLGWNMMGKGRWGQALGILKTWLKT